MVAVETKKLFFLNANRLDLGCWNKLAIAAKKANTEILLVGENYTPDPEKWNYVWFAIPEMSKWETLDFVVEIIKMCSPDDIWIKTYEGQKYLTLWFD
jgi:hypothetical protein